MRRLPSERPGHSGTTAHFQAVYPFLGQGGLGAAGAYIGRDAYGGAWMYDPWALYPAHLPGPNMLMLGGIASDTLSYVSRVLGAGEFEQRSRSTGEKGRRSETEGDTYRDLAPANFVRERDPGTGLLVYGHLPPAKIRLRPWYEDRELRRLRDGHGAEEARR